jgi:hypothetical protein|tara:strand:- start:12 stop:197 length:186 start_codon:yes stop_codon:yes gene_type:complete
MSKFRYKVENTLAKSNEEFQQWLNHQGEGEWELINTRVLNEEIDKRGNRETFYQCIFKTKN